MNRFLMLCTMWCLSVVPFSPQQVGNVNGTSAATAEKLRAIVSVLRTFWGQDFDSNYEKYLLGPSPTVVLIARDEMLKIAAARLDGRQRDGATTQGLTIGEKPKVKIVVVYDDIAPLLVAKTIHHEIGHLQLRGEGLSRNDEEARIRKIVDTSFFEILFGREWLETTIAILQKTVLPVEKKGRLYQGHTAKAVEMLYQQIRKAGIDLEQNSLHDRILENMVFILTNSEESLSAALDADDDAH